MSLEQMTAHQFVNRIQSMTDPIVIKRCKVFGLYVISKDLFRISLFHGSWKETVNN